MTLHVIGIGLDGVAGLAATSRQILAQATVLCGSARHLASVPDAGQQRIVLQDFTRDLAQLHPYLNDDTATIALLASGDPLFFGVGRLLLQTFPAAQLHFHPHVSSLQLAFSRAKLPWQNARLLSVHGRSPEELITALQQGAETLAVLTDGVTTPGAIARLVQALDLPTPYRFWVCENLGGAAERITQTDDPATVQSQTFAPLNVVILQRQPATTTALDLAQLPRLGIPDQAFLSFRDRPGLMTKREVRVHILAALALPEAAVVWDIGAGTGSVSVEIGRLCPAAQICAIEKTALGHQLIQQNCQRFQVTNVTAINGTAPAALADLPIPDRIFIGGSGGQLTPLLDTCAHALAPHGRLVLALATLEHLTTVLQWGTAHPHWQVTVTQLQVTRSVPIAHLTRLQPLNPVTLVVLERSAGVRVE